MLSSALEILKIINNNNYEAYIVGGFVRDYLLNIKSEDIDIATNMPLEELNKFFKVNSNSKYGSFVIKKDSYFFEVTQFRKELSYKNQRHPEIQLVNSYKEDYIRRDFTINALGFDFNLDLIDYCNGKVDLDNKLIKTIREPNETFIEDPVRILRAIYFKNKLNLNYEEKTYESLVNNSKELIVISNNRIITELSKMTSSFNLYINDLINTNVYNNIIFKEVILFIYENKININNINNIYELYYYLNNNLNIEVESNIKKDIDSYMSLCNLKLTNRFVFNTNRETFIKLNNFNILIKNNDELHTYDEIYNSNCIKSITDIDFNLKELNKYIDVKMINKTKDLIIDKILNNELNNTSKDILNFINNL
ncbi:MAG: hypothetical protein R3Y05_01795 [bacterium]